MSILYMSVEGDPGAAAEQTLAEWIVEFEIYSAQPAAGDRGESCSLAASCV